MYISDKISHKLRNDINIYYSKQLESVFVEVLIPNKQNQLIRTIYNIFKFNHEYLTDILTKLKNESNSLSSYYKNRGIYKFLEQLFNHNFTPQITLPTRITEKTATLIDNIFVNGQTQKYNSGNITTSISDHLPQFIITENGKGGKPTNKNFDMESFKF